MRIFAGYDLAGRYAERHASGSAHEVGKEFTERTVISARWFCIVLESQMHCVRYAATGKENLGGNITRRHRLGVSEQNTVVDKMRCFQRALKCRIVGCSR